MLPEDRLFRLIEDFMRLPHVEIVRVGTRLPVVLPQRFTSSFCARLGTLGPVWLATHFNHPNEMTPEACLACENLVRSGVPVVNQSVLLRGVNDSPDVLSALFSGLLRMRVKPYYLFHGDPVAGTMHFRTGVERALKLMEQVGDRVSGLALPAFAFDLPGGRGKIRLEPDRIAGSVAGVPLFRGRDGAAVPYRSDGEAISSEGD